ncbi:hypothetical protein BC835DRAFT_1409763 [Cytidiella melzeri]|nr:hypothetical protein BC835DRAFT_1409763 [Cytidiella melzeri]
MAAIGLDIATLLYYLSWNLDINSNSEDAGKIRHPQKVVPSAAEARGRHSDTSRANVDGVMGSRQHELTEESLLTIKLDQMASDYQAVALITWDLLHSGASTPFQLKQNTYKNHSASVLAIINMLQYGQSHHRSKFQRLMSVYFTSCVTWIVQQRPDFSNIVTSLQP